MFSLRHIFTIKNTPTVDALRRKQDPLLNEDSRTVCSDKPESKCKNITKRPKCRWIFGCTRSYDLPKGRRINWLK